MLNDFPFLAFFDFLLSLLTIGAIVMSLIFMIFLVYFVIGIWVGMYHVSIKEDYDVSDFFGVMICWPKFLWYRIKGKVWL